MDTLSRIKRVVLAGNFEFSEKARVEMFADGLVELDIVEAIANARQITKTLRSANPHSGKREYLYIIVSPNLQGLLLYTKGKLVAEMGVETYYFLISAKDAD